MKMIIRILIFIHKELRNYSLSEFWPFVSINNGNCEDSENVIYKLAIKQCCFSCLLSYNIRFSFSYYRYK